MKLFYSKIKKKKLLHIVFRFSDFKELGFQGRKDLISEKEFLQLSALKLNKGKSFDPHKHIWKDGEKKVIAQESWVVIKGKVKCTFFDLDGTNLSKQILEEGDCSVTLHGGHTYTILENNTLVYEFKTGPYKGNKLDKELLNED